MNSSLSNSYQAHSNSQDAGSGALTSPSAGRVRFRKRRAKASQLARLRRALSSDLEASVHEEFFELDLLIPTTSGWRRPSLRISADCEFGVIRDVAISFDR